MGKIYFGEFEELILLTVGALYDNAYAVAIAKEISNETGRPVNVSAVHRTLYRLEKKGMLESSLGEPESKRGGKRKRIFQMTGIGKRALSESMELRMTLWNKIPDLSVKLQYV